MNIDYMELKGHPINKRCYFEQPNNSGLCVWCKKNHKKNISHIISKSLILTERPENKLKFSVCEKCNAFWGTQIEDWFFKYTPIGHWKENIQNIKTKNTIAKNFRFIPNFIYLEYFKEWIVVNHNKGSEILPTQIFLTKENRFKIFHRTSNPQLRLSELYEQFSRAVKDKDFTIYMSPLLAPDNHPRIFRYKEKYIIIARNNVEIENFIFQFSNIDIKRNTTELIVDNRIGRIGQMHVHYKWSISRFISLSCKIVFEFLTLIKGPEFTLSTEFDDFRHSLLHPKTKYDNLSILNVSDKGFAVKRLNYPNWITPCNNLVQKSKVRIPSLILNNEERYTYSIVIYKYDDFICATVKLFQIEHSKIILSKTKQSLGKIYAITYSLEDDSLNLYESSESETVYDELILVPYFNGDLDKLIQ